MTAAGNDRGPSTPLRVVVLAGGYGGAKLSHGVAMLAEAPGSDIELSVIVNTGDDLELHGLLVCPDLDTVMYTLAGLANDATGWGVRDETWSAREMLERYGQETWFGLGDRDIATHLVRSKRMRAGARLTEVEAELAQALGIQAQLLPMTDDIVRTKLRTDDGWLSFQDYFVQRHHADDVHEVHFHGIEHAQPTTEVLEAIADADRILIAPSNPFVSVGTILAVPGLLDALLEAPSADRGREPAHRRRRRARPGRPHVRDPRRRGVRLRRRAPLRRALPGPPRCASSSTRSTPTRLTPSGPSGSRSDVAGTLMLSDDDRACASLERRWRPTA